MPLSKSSDLKSTSFTVEKAALREFQQRVRRHGDRSLILRRLLEMFLKNEVVVELPTRRL